MGWELIDKGVTPGERWAAVAAQVVCAGLAGWAFWFTDGDNGSWRIVWIYIAVAVLVLLITGQVIHQRVRARQQRR